MPVSERNRLQQQDADLRAEIKGYRTAGNVILKAARKENRDLTAAEDMTVAGYEAQIVEAEAKLESVARNLARENQFSDDLIAANPPPAADANRWVNPVTAVNEPHPFPTMGDQLRAIATVGRGLDDGRTRERLINAVASGSNEAVDSEGGFLLLPEFLGGIEKQMYATGQVLSRVRQIEVGANSNGIVMRRYVDTSRATGSRNGGVRGYWVEEAEAPTDSKPTFEKFELKLKKVAALGYATDELLADVAAMNSMFPADFADELTFLVEDSIISGDGASKPLGIVGHAGTISVAKETGQAAATILYENVRKMRSRLLASLRAGAVWLVNAEAEAALETMTFVVGTGGVPVFLPPGGLSTDGYSRLYGLPVIPVEYCSALGTVGDIILANLNQYAMIRKGGVQQASSMHVKFTTDEMAFRATYRCDGAPLRKSAITPFKGTDTHGTFVTVATRA